MSEGLRFHQVRVRDLRDADGYRRWLGTLQDPDAIAGMAEPKRRLILECPCLESDDWTAQLLAIKGDRVIGRIDAIPGRLIVDGSPVPIAWGSLLTVPEAQRHTLAGAFLVMRLSAIFGVVGAHGPSRMALPLYEKLKYADIPLRRMILVRRSRSVVEKHLGRNTAARGAALAVDAGLLAHRAMLWGYRKLAGLGLRVRRVERCPESLDAALSGGTERVRVWRSSAWINWVLSHTMEDHEHAFRRDLFLIEGSGGEVLGYFLTKMKFYPVASASGFRDLTLGSLQDWGSFGAEIDVRAIVLAAARELCAFGADAVEVCTPGDGRALRRMGFVGAGSMHLMVKGKGDGVIREADAWRVRPGDGDNAFV